MDRGGLRLHGNHWSSLLGDSRALAVMAIMYDGKFDMNSCNGFFTMTRHFSTKLSRALCIQKRIEMILHNFIVIQFWIFLMIYAVKVRQLHLVELCFLRGRYIQKNLTAEKFWRQKV